MFKILPYKMGSTSVKKLKDGLDAMIIKLENSRYRFNPRHIVINWGNSRRPVSLDNVPMVNEPEKVAIAADKLLTLQELDRDGVPHVPFTTDKEVAREWNKVFVRHNLSGHSGLGIEVVESTATEPDISEFEEDIAEILQELNDEADTPRERNLMERLIHTLSSVVNTNPPLRTITLPDAPLYTKAIVNTGEYRVHVMDGEVILYQKKSRRVDDSGNVITAEGEEADVRNLASNWIYRTGNLTRLERIEELAINAIDTLGLDFGAVDIIKDEEGNVFVLEINTAPGLGNQETLEAYIDGFNQLIS